VEEHKNIWEMQFIFKTEQDIKIMY